MVRPERLRVVPIDESVPSSCDRLTARVDDCVYLGSDRTVHLSTADGEKLVARTPVPRVSDRISTGADVNIFWDVEDARVLS